MSLFPMISAALFIASQPAAPEPPPVVLVDLAQLPLEEAAPPRCAVVFAIIEGLQQAGDTRAVQWPDLAKGNGREYFVRAMARLMDARALDRDQIATLTSREASTLSADEYKRAHELMEPCLLMKKAAGL